MNQRQGLPWLLPLFVGSGGAALVYEVVWLQFLQLIVGLTSVSLGILLGTFMGGMCLGSLLFPRLVSSRFHPLRVYALLEVGIGVVAIALLFVLPWLTQAYGALGGQGVSGVFFRGIFAALLLLPPTMLMGATLPALARWVDSTKDGIAWLGFFYGGNIAGAVIGSLAAGFYLLRVYDMATATYVAAGCNALVALAAWCIAARIPRCQENVAAHAEVAGVRARPWLIYLAIGLSGMAALGSEVVWTRLLSLTLGGTVYTFAIILAVMLLGLGIGSTVGASLARTLARPGRALAVCQVMVGVAVAWASWMISSSLPYWPIDPALSTSPWFTFQLDGVRCLWVMLPAACLWGASFPLALAAVGPGTDDPGRVVGTTYAANTVGAILGALLFSLVVVPLLGSQAAERIMIGLAALAALCAFAHREVTSRPGAIPASGWNRRWTALTRAAGVVAVACVLAWSVSPAPWGLVAYGRHMATWGDRLAPEITSPSNVPAESGGEPDIFCTYLGEGINGSVAVTQFSSGVRNFHAAGKVQASTDSRDMRLQRMLGHLSALAHPQPETVLVVACGAGVTAGAFVVHPTVQRIVICDIEPLVPQRVAPMFSKENHGVIQDSRTAIVADDGRHFLRTTRGKFDVITSDPIDAWVKGCAALNTIEYYELCKARLKPGGVVSLWVPLYESNRAVVQSLMATFFRVFPNSLLFSNDVDGEGYDAVLLGKVEPFQIDLDELHSRWTSEDHLRVRQSLRGAGFHSVTGLLSTYAGRPTDLEPWLRHAQINTDRNLRLQYLAGFALNSSQGAIILDEILHFKQFPADLFVGSEWSRRVLKLAVEGRAIDPVAP